MLNGDSGEGDAARERLVRRALGDGGSCHPPVPYALAQNPAIFPEENSRNNRLLFAVFRDTLIRMASTRPKTNSPARAALPFSDDLKQVLQGLRGALTDALSTIGVDPARPQEVARRLGLHRNLTWKVSKIVTSTDVFSAVPHVPGRTGMQILDQALRKVGAPAGGLERIRSAK